jgi:hypothetical protein
MRLAVTGLLAIIVGLLLARDAYSCSVYRTRPFSSAEMVAESDAIILAKAEGYAAAPRDSRSSSPLIPDLNVRFKVIEVIRAKLPMILGLVENGYLVLPGTLVGKDDFNDQAAPYTFVRPEGRHGNCYATSYRSGAQFLLMLKRGHEGDLTVYWNPLAPVNEQVRPDDDAWVLWVRKEIKQLDEQSAKHPAGQT